MVLLNKSDYVDIYKTEDIEGVPVYVVEDNYIRVQLTSNRIDKNMIRKISRHDYIQLETVAELVTNKDIIAKVYSKGFSASDFYVVLLGKALRDKDFLRWFKGYGFKINLYKLKK